MSDLPPAVLDLNPVLAARVAAAERRESMRPFVVTVASFSVGIVPPNGDPDMAPAGEMLDAADLVSDPGRLGEIARGLVARVEGTKGRSVDRA